MLWLSPNASFSPSLTTIFPLLTLTFLKSPKVKMPSIIFDSHPSVCLQSLCPILSHSLSHTYLWVISHWRPSFALLSALGDVFYKLRFHSLWNSPSIELPSLIDLPFSIEFLVPFLVGGDTIFHSGKETYFYFLCLPSVPSKAPGPRRNLVDTCGWLISSSHYFSSQAFVPFLSLISPFIHSVSQQTLTELHAHAGSWEY